MMGARHAAGSTISNGGGMSSSSWVIVRRCSESALLTAIIGLQDAAFKVPLSVIAVAVPSEITLNLPKGKLAAGIEGCRLIRAQIGSRNTGIRRCRVASFTRNLLSVGLSGAG